MTARGRIFTYGPAALAVVVGVVCGAVIQGETGGLLATILGGLGLVAITGLIFMEVGLSEDRERERETRAREREVRAREREERKRAWPLRQASRLERLRGQRRRLP